MKKVIKLTESDLENLVKKIIKETGDTWFANKNNHTQEEMNEVWEKLNGMNSDIVFEMMDKTFNYGTMSVRQFVDYLPTWFGYDEEELISILEQIKEEGI